MNRQTRARLNAVQQSAKAALLAHPPSAEERAFLDSWCNDRTVDGLLPPTAEPFDEPTARQIYAELAVGLDRDWPAPTAADFAPGQWARFRRLSEFA